MLRLIVGAALVAAVDGGLVTCSAYWEGCNIVGNECQCYGASGCSSPFEYTDKKACEAALTPIDCLASLPFSGCNLVNNDCECDETFACTNPFEYEDKASCEAAVFPPITCTAIFFGCNITLGNTCECGAQSGCSNPYKYNDKEACEAALPVFPCPMPFCAAPPEGCTYVFTEELNELGCPLYPCGQLECMCATPLCIPPQGFCVFNAEKSAEIDPETGCPKDPCSYDCLDDPCGPIPDCAAPPEWCNYVPDPNVDENGCPLNPCGNLQCCEPALCPFPGDDCMLVPGTIDMTIDPDTGCPVNECGEYVCSECSTNEECDSMQVCRTKQVENGNGCMPFEIKECVPAAQEGELCGGYMLPCFYQDCGAGLVCTGDQLAVDGPGTCSCIAEPGSGNINADEEVSILDIVLGVKLVLKNEDIGLALSCAKNAADMNFDETIDILDIVQIVSVVQS